MLSEEDYGITHRLRMLTISAIGNNNENITVPSLDMQTVLNIIVRLDTENFAYQSTVENLIEEVEDLTLKYDQATGRA